MNADKLTQQAIGLIFAVLALAGCSGAAAQPTATPAPVSSTEIFLCAPPVPSEEREGVVLGGVG